MLFLCLWPMKDPWDERYIYLHEWVMYYGKLVGKYTVRPMDPLTLTHVFSNIFTSSKKTDSNFHCFQPPKQIPTLHQFQPTNPNQRTLVRWFHPIWKILVKMEKIGVKITTIWNHHQPTNQPQPITPHTHRTPTKPPPPSLHASAPPAESSPPRPNSLRSQGPMLEPWRVAPPQGVHRVPWFESRLPQPAGGPSGFLYVFCGKRRVVVVQKILLMAEIRRSPVEVGSLSHYS